MVKKDNKIRKYRKPLNLNIGMLIFGTIFIYVIICVVMYFRTSHIVRYEVKEGSLATNNIYRGIILREETVVNTDTAGYVNLYTREGERVAKNDLVFTIDETGHLNEYLKNSDTDENNLTDKQLLEFRSDIVNFKHGFDEHRFDNVYDFKISMKNTVLKLANVNMLNNINKINSDTAGIVNFCKAPFTGIVAYWVDGYEDLTAEQVTEDVFDETNGYEKKHIIGNSLLETGDAVYKLSTDENWSVIIPIDAERGAEIEKEGYVKVRFLKNRYESWGATKLLHNSDGKTYLQLSFTNSMITFISDRFTDVELILFDDTGLKIPNSSIVQKEFYLIPEEYILLKEESGTKGVNRLRYLEDGTSEIEFITIDVYSYNEESKEYYVGTDILNAGDVLYKGNSQESFTVSKRATLIGVYNMNKGYADFKQIHILYQNDEYAIVKANTTYGLNVYDYIVLNAEAVVDDQLLNQ